MQCIQEVEEEIIVAHSICFRNTHNADTYLEYAAFVLKPESRKLMITNLSELLAISKQSTDSQRQGRFSMPINRLLVTLNIK